MFELIDFLKTFFGKVNAVYYFLKTVQSISKQYVFGLLVVVKILL